MVDLDEYYREGRRSTKYVQKMYVRGQDITLYGFL